MYRDSRLEWSNLSLMMSIDDGDSDIGDDYNFADTKDATTKRSKDA